MTSCQVTRDRSAPAVPAGPSTWAIAAVGAALVAVCYGFARFAYGLFVPTFRAEFGLDGATAGAVASGGYLGYCVAVVAATAATDRWGPRPVALAAGSTAAVGTTLVAAAPSAVVLACGVVLAGSSTGLASPPLAQAVARAVPARLEPRVQSVVNAGTGLGVLVSGPVALILTDQWRVAWAAFAVAALLVTLAVARTVPGADHPSPASLATVPVRRPAGLGRLLTAAGLLGLGSAAVWTFGKEVVTTASGDVLATAVWIALGAAGLLGALAGDLSTRIGLARSWSAAMVLLAGATAALGLASDRPVVALGAGAVFGAVYIALTGLLLLWGAGVDPARPVRGVGAAFLLIAVGQALGAPLLGLLVDRAGVGAAFLAAGAVLVLGAFVRRPASP